MITNTIIHNGKIIGYKIKTGEIQYSTCKAGLMSKSLFETLNNEGYKYFGNGIFETKDSISIDSLPVVEYMDLSADERSEFDIAENLYEDKDVQEYMSKKPPIDAPKWEKPYEFLIHTRDDLWKFLN